jgi:hypothetical protein
MERGIGSTAATTFLPQIRESVHANEGGSDEVSEGTRSLSENSDRREGEID